MYACAQCSVYACTSAAPEALPQNCPMHQKQLFEESFSLYGSPENHKFYVTASEIEGIGYGQWVRLREILELCHRMSYRKIGLAFCKGLRHEAKIIDALLRRNGFEVVSVICKTGGIPKESAGICAAHKIHPEGFEPMCNPITQAKLLNEQHTEFNLEVGLCVGHDSLFYKYSNALVTTLIAKDRVLAHNPVGAVYCAEGYCKDRLTPAE